MHRGYVKDWRKSLDSPLFRSPLTWHFWTYCRLKATRKKRTSFISGQAVELLPGQFIFGRKVAADETGLTERNIRTAIKHLKATKQVTIKTTNKFSIITVCNWDTYQPTEIESDQQCDQQSDQVATSKRPSSDQVATTDKNVKNVKNVKNTTCDDGELFPTDKTDKPRRIKDRIVYNYDDDTLSGIELDDIKKWEEAYPAVDISLSILQAKNWLAANHSKRKKDVPRFLLNWFSREQEKGGGSAKRSSLKSATQKSLDDCHKRALECAERQESGENNNSDEVMI